jgi:hypothetical protein
MLAKFIPDLENMDVNCSLDNVRTLTPDLIEECITTEDASGMSHQEMQELEFLAGKEKLLATQLDSIARSIYLKIVDNDLFFEFLFREFWSRAA